MSQDEIIRLLSENEIFGGLSEEELKKIHKFFAVENFNKNEIIVDEGGTNISFYLIIEGQVEVYLPKTSGVTARLTKIKLNTLSAGSCFGEFSIIDKRPASASVMALSEVKLLRLFIDDFEKIINLDDSLAKRVYKNLLLMAIYRIRNKDKELDELCF